MWLFESPEHKSSKSCCWGKRGTLTHTTLLLCSCMKVHRHLAKLTQLLFLNSTNITGTFKCMAYEISSWKDFSALYLITSSLESNCIMMVLEILATTVDVQSLLVSKKSDLYNDNKIMMLLNFNSNSMKPCQRSISFEFCICEISFKTGMKKRQTNKFKICQTLIQNGIDISRNGNIQTARQSIFV